MIVLIDGYNLLKVIFYKEKGKLDSRRKILVRQLACYMVQKNKKIRQIIVVFDGGLFRHATREVHSGIVVIFSGQKSNADEWIINYSDKHKSSELLLVSNDRPLKEKCAKNGADSVSVSDFYQIVQNTISEDFSKEERVLPEAIFKKDEKLLNLYSTGLEGFNSKDYSDYDVLMQDADFSEGDKEECYYDDAKENIRKGKAKKKSKKDKKLYRKVRKL